MSIHGPYLHENTCVGNVRRCHAFALPFSSSSSFAAAVIVAAASCTASARQRPQPRKNSTPGGGCCASSRPRGQASRSHDDADEEDFVFAKQCRRSSGERRPTLSSVIGRGRPFLPLPAKLRAGHAGSNAAAPPPPRLRLLRFRRRCD